MKTIRQILEERAVQFNEKPAIIFKEQTISFRQLKENVFKLAHFLQKQGVKQGERIAVYLPNSPEYIYSYLASFCLGAVCVPLDYMLKEDELISCLSHSEAKILIAKRKTDVDLVQIQKSVVSVKTLLFLEDLEQIIVENEKGNPASPAGGHKGLPLQNNNDNDPALIMYTSGTTGKPKGILLNYKHLEGSPLAMKHFVDLTDRDVKLAAIPLSHIGGFIYIQNCLHFGITLILMERFNPFEFLENISRHKITCFHIVPAMYTAILTLKEIERFDLSSLRWMVVFGAPSSPEILKRFHQYCPNAELLNGWGMTETCPPNTVTPLGSNKIESVGKPSNNCEIKIFDESDKELSPGQIGEIVIRGPYIMAGYYKDPEGTKEMMRDGWLHTGDLGRFDEEGFLYIAGRKKEMIKVGGQIVYAPEVEAAFHKHEGVAEVAVIGMSDQMRGEVVKAFVVLKEGVEITTEDLRYFARQHLAHFKVPHSIELRKELPKNRTGKVDKELLKGKNYVSTNA